MGSSSSALRTKFPAVDFVSEQTHADLTESKTTGADNAEQQFEFSMWRLPYQCLRQIAASLNSDDLLSLCQTSPENCRLFGAELFWHSPASIDATCTAVGAYESLNSALERKFCLPIESLNHGTYLPSLAEPDSYSGRVVYLHDLNCRTNFYAECGGDGCGRREGSRLSIHDYVTGLPRGTYQVTLRAKLGAHWKLQGVTEVLLVPDLPRLDCLLRARIPERKWRSLAFRHGFERWFCLRLGRLSLPQSSGIRVQILNSRVSKSHLKEGVYLDYIELTPLACPIAEFVGYRRARQRDEASMDAAVEQTSGGETCQLL